MLLYLLACTPEPAEVLDDDTRVDAADDSLALDSNQTRMCITPAGSIFVFWVDSRRGPNVADLWMTRSDDLGETWFEIPARVSRGNGRVRDPVVDCSEGGVVAVWTDDRDSNQPVGKFLHQGQQCRQVARVVAKPGQYLPADTLLPLGFHAHPALSN